MTSLVLCQTPSPNHFSSLCGRLPPPPIKGAVTSGQPHSTHVVWRSDIVSAIDECHGLVWLRLAARVGDPAGLDGVGRAVKVAIFVPVVGPAKSAALEPRLLDPVQHPPLSHHVGITGQEILVLTGCILHHLQIQYL